ncbi:MAG TPA: hypothetical protein VJH03_10895 [Blastocatellia bacterium]|nr:hypothetical protein [Blastocatellia bacterium]
MISLPLRAAFFEDPLQQHVGWLVVAAFGAGQFGFGGNESAFASSFQHGRAVTVQVCANPLECCHRRIKPRELLLDLCDNTVLF